MQKWGEMVIVLFILSTDIKVSKKARIQVAEDIIESTLCQLP